MVCFSKSLHFVMHSIHPSGLSFILTTVNNDWNCKEEAVLGPKQDKIVSSDRSLSKLMNGQKCHANELDDKECFDFAPAFLYLIVPSDSFVHIKKHHETHAHNPSLFHSVYPAFFIFLQCLTSHLLKPDHLIVYSGAGILVYLHFRIIVPHFSF